jgi:catechol 2,3-dioxygenase-like lactoylglutathione lyase family enzyme
LEIIHVIEAIKMIKKLDHALISSSDIDRSLAFYRDTLGLKVEFEDETSGREFALVMGAPSDFRARVVQFEEGLEICQFISPEGKQLDTKPWDIGAILLDFEVSDLDGMYSALADKGVNFISPPIALRSPHPGGGSLKIAQLTGPDGERIVLLEFPRIK